MVLYGVDPIPYSKLSNTVVSFPNLRRLETLEDYQLGDDTLFRGNHSSPALSFLDAKSICG